MSKIDQQHNQIRSDLARSVSSQGDKGSQIMDHFRQQFSALAKTGHLPDRSILKLEIAQASHEQRQMMARETLKVLTRVPGFTAPPMQKQISAPDLRNLFKQVVVYDKQGAFQRQAPLDGKAALEGKATLESRTQLENKAQLDGKLQPSDKAQLDSKSQTDGKKPLEGKTTDNSRPDMARKGDSSPVGKQFSQFVQAPTANQPTRPGNELGRDDTLEQPLASEMLEGHVAESEGPSLRSPMMTGEPFAAMTNKQKLDLMTTAFGPDIATQLKQAGIRDPLSLLQQAVTPEDRAGLAKTLDVPRSELLVHLARAELLLIGAGRNGEQALRPQHLPALANAGIVTLAQMAGAKTLSPAEFDSLYQMIRANYGGFAQALSGERPILKKDMQHWVKMAGRRKSSILDADWDDLPQRQGDAEEMIMAWYLEHMNDRSNQRSSSQHSRQQANERVLADLPKFSHDPARGDGLICFWIERPNFNTDRPTFTEKVYVCLDPKTGIIDPKQVE